MSSASGPLGPALADAVSTSLIKTGRLQLQNLVLPAWHGPAEHHVDDECTIQCLEAMSRSACPIGTRRLGPGQLVVLPAGQVHALSARVASAVLVTLLLNKGDAGDGGGRDHGRPDDRAARPGGADRR
jgi:hypothetical protein